MKYVTCSKCKTKIDLTNIAKNPYKYIKTKKSWKNCDEMQYITCPKCGNDVLLSYGIRKNAFNKDSITTIESDEDEFINLTKDSSNDNKSFSPRIVFDFDGVIHSYKTGWVREDIIQDEPTEGIQDVINYLKTCGYIICIQSSRAFNERGYNAIVEYCNYFDINYDELTYEKKPALLYIDDNGYRYHNMNDLMDFLKDNRFI